MKKGQCMTKWEMNISVKMAQKEVVLVLTQEIYLHSFLEGVVDLIFILEAVIRLVATMEAPHVLKDVPTIVMSGKSV